MVHPTPWQSFYRNPMVIIVLRDRFRSSYRRKITPSTSKTRTGKFTQTGSTVRIQQQTLHPIKRQKTRSEVYSNNHPVTSTGKIPAVVHLHFEETDSGPVSFFDSRVHRLSMNASSESCFLTPFCCTIPLHHLPAVTGCPQTNDLKGNPAAPSPDF